MTHKNSSSIRFKPEDEELLDRLKKETGIVQSSEVVRMGLRALADKLGLKR